MSNYVCQSCGKPTKRLYPRGTCQGCYNYFRGGGTIHSRPETGTIVRDDRGFVICHVCGRSYRRLGSHVKESHGLTIEEYKNEFGLCHNAKTTETRYSRHMRDLAIRSGAPARLCKAGEATRIKTGDRHLRLGKKAALQECKDKRARYSKH